MHGADTFILWLTFGMVLILGVATYQIATDIKVIRVTLEEK